MLNTKNLSTQEMLHLLAQNSGMGGGKPFSRGDTQWENHIKSLIHKFFPPEEWDNAWMVLVGGEGASGENTTLDASAIGEHEQKDGTLQKDYGLFQINEAANSEAIMKKYGYTMEDLLDPEKNIQVAADLFLGRIPGNRPGWWRWYGAPDRLTKRQEPDYSQYVTGAQVSAPTPTPTPTPSPTVSPTPGFTMTVNGKPFTEPKPLISPDYVNRVKSAWKDLQTPDLIDPTKLGPQSPPRGFGQEVVDFFKTLFGGQPTKVTQAFGVKNPKIEKFTKGGVNTGTDLAAAIGTPVNLPPGNWKVVEAFRGDKGRGFIGNKTNRGYGNSILVQNSDTGEKIRLSHLSEVYVTPGQVLRGGTVAKTGATGNVTGPHLDLEYYDARGQLGDINRATFNRAATTQPLKAQPLSMNVPRQPQTTVQTALQRTPMPSRSQTAVSQPYTAVRSVPSPQAAQYTVQRGDTLSSIASRSGTTVAKLAAANRISNPNLIRSGASLKLA